MVSSREIVFLADLIIDPTNISKWNLGTEHKIGGAEQDDAAMLHYLREDITRIPIAQLTTIEANKSYIISNFWSIPELLKTKLIRYKNYILYEHDHHYCKTRNPAMFPGFKVPTEMLENLDLFSNAKAVICMSKLHKSIVDLNVKCNSVSIGTSFWYEIELRHIEHVCGLDKQAGAVIYGNESPHKGMLQAIQYCTNHKMLYTILPNQDSRTEFLNKLGSYQYFVFMPQSPETHSRITVEAKMMGVKIITNQLVGAIHEDWTALNGKNLIEYMDRVLIPNATKIIKSYL